MAQTKPTSIFYQVQQIIADQLNSDEMLSAASVVFIPENAKDIDYEVGNALGKQGIVGVVMTPRADYTGITAPGELAYDLRDITVQIVENVPVNRGLSASITALDAAQRVQELLASPHFTTFGVMCPKSIEQGEDNGLIVCQAKFDCSIHTTYEPVPPAPERSTKWKYAGSDEWHSQLVEGEFTSSSLPDIGDISEIEIGYSVTSIAASAFYECTKLNSAAIPNSVTAIGANAFENCTGLSSVDIPSSVTSLEERAFRGCTSLTNVTIPDSVTSIGSSVFYYCKELTSVTIGNSVESIGSSAFYYCTSLQSVTIPDSVETIGNQALGACTSLSSVTIGNNVESIGEAAFDNCKSLVSVTIPDSVASIGEYAFERCLGLSSIEFGDSLSSIGANAFTKCSSLAEAALPASIQSIGANAFYKCGSLSSLTFEGKTIQQIQAMDNYPWGITDTSIIVGDTQPLEWIPGGYKSNGVTTPGVLYTPDYIPVEKNHNITWKWGDSNIGASVQAYLMTYNDDKQILTYWTPNGATGQRTFNVGANASYIRYSVIAGFQDTTFVKDETTGQYLVKNGEIIF